MPAGIALMLETSPKPLMDIPKPMSVLAMDIRARSPVASNVVGIDMSENAIAETTGCEVAAEAVFFC